MTIRITIKNEDDTREIAVEYVDPKALIVEAGELGSTAIGPQGSAEFFVHSTQAVIVREVTE